MKTVESIAESAHRYQHILDELLFFVHPAGCLTLCQLQQRHFGWYHPAKNISEQWVVTKRYDVLE